jgi:CRISPR-associated exonuclease Cas4
MDIDDYLALSGIQHFAFCPRQWALVHLEGVWAENARTAEGRHDHERCHDGSLREKRGDLITVRGLRVVSHMLRLVGVCDVVELSASDKGVPIIGEKELYLPVPVEYKHGKKKTTDEDRLQLCAQAMALEEMFACEVSRGYLFYVAERRREEVPIDDVLRAKTKEVTCAMWAAFERGVTQPAKKRKGCAACSLAAECMPELVKAGSVQTYLENAIKDEAI